MKIARGFGLLLFMVMLTLPPAALAGPLTGIKIFLDPGHGGVAGQTYGGSPGDPGAVGPTGRREADCVLALATHLKGLLEAQGATVHMSRSTDVFVSLAGRTAAANALATDRLVSIHQNASSNPAPNYTGTHIYTSASANSRDMAAKTAVELDRYHGIGVVSTNCGLRGVHADNFHMVRESSMPAQLIENSFISNAAEETRLKQASHLQASANAVFLGLMAHFGKTVTTDVNPPTISHSPVTNAVEGAALVVSATVTDASGVAAVVFNYRKKGAAAWTSVATTKEAGEIYSASIPAAAVTTAGLEYYLTARDQAGNSGNLPAGAPGSPCVVNVSARTGILTGVLTDPATGARLGGVTVTAAPGGAVAVASSTGVYRFEDLTAGSYVLTGRLPDYRDGGITVTLEAGATKWGSFTLERIPEAHVIGKVVDGSGRGLAGVSVKIGALATVSAADGSFSAGPFRYGAYALTATLAGFANASLSVTAGANQPAVAVVMNPVSSGATARVYGTVNVPATVTLVTTGQTATGTAYNFTNLAPGSYQLKVVADGHRSQTRTFSMATGQARVANFFLLAFDKGILRVKVKQVNASGRVVNGQGVTVAIAGPVAMTRPTGWGGVSGEALFDGLPPGVYTVTAGSLRQTVTIVAGKSVSLTLGP